LVVDEDAYDCDVRFDLKPFHSREEYTRGIGWDFPVRRLPQAVGLDMHLSFREVVFGRQLIQNALDIHRVPPINLVQHRKKWREHTQRIFDRIENTDIDPNWIRLYRSDLEELENETEE
jgi:hypothetical protein